MPVFGHPPRTTMKEGPIGAVEQLEFGMGQERNKLR